MRLEVERALKLSAPNAGEIARRLAQQAENVVAYLLPNGQRKVSHWVVGSIAGEEGGSLKIALAGEDAGLWLDHADDSQRGDMLDLWAAVRGLNTSEALREAKAFLGWQEPTNNGQAYRKPNPPKKPPITGQDAALKRQQSQEKATALWKQGKPARNHPYTDKKGLEPSGLRVKGNLLLIPMYDADKKLTCVQTINSKPKPGEKAKKFLYGCQAKDCYLPIGTPTDNTVIICEGWATGKSVNMATGLAVAAAISSGNIPNVARIMREKDPDYKIVIAPDNDKNRHAIEIAEAAARQYGCSVVYPEFPEGATGTDFDDLRQVASRDEVKRQIMDCRYQPSIETEAPRIIEAPDLAIHWPDYPLEALGPVLSEAAQAIANTVQVPKHLAGQSVLAAVALATQAHGNIRNDNRVSPLSLYLVTIGESGVRKSGCDQWALKPHREWEREQQKQARENFADYRNEADTWKRDRGVALKKGQSLDSIGPEPEPPAQGVFICPEPTLEGLQRSFRYGLASQGLFSDEGAQFFGGSAMSQDNLMKTVAGLSCFWDGSPIKRTRAATGESWAGHDRRLSFHLMVQPIIAGMVLTNPIMQQQGILARFLIASGNHLFGQRQYRQPHPNDLAAIDRYHAAMSRLLAEPWDTDEDGGLILQAIEPTSEAKALWIEAYNAIEEEIADGGRYEDMRASASKAAENIARIAGVLTVFNGQTEIDAATMDNAIQLGAYYVEQYLMHTHSGRKIVIQDQVQRLWQWLKDQGRDVIDVNFISTRAPRDTGVRNSVDRVRAAMAHLSEYGTVRTESTDSRNQPATWKLLA
jgi:phage/plasmid primase-like uncharacterized protein